MKVLVVDDEPTILETIENRLRREGFTVFRAGTAEEGMRLFKQARPDLLILDLMLPQRSGQDLCRAIRRDSQVPIIFLTAKTSESDRVAGFEMGADDYVTKPFSLAELTARVRAVLRRATGEAPPEPVQVGRIRLDPKSHEAWLGDSPMNLAPKEYALLYFLARNPGQVFTRDVLLDRIWGQDAFVGPRTVDVHIRWLRERIEEDPSRPKHLVTVRGIGYKFVV